MIDPFHTIIETLENFKYGNNVDTEKEKSIDAPFSSWTKKNHRKGRKFWTYALKHTQTYVFQVLEKWRTSWSSSPRVK